MGKYKNILVALDGSRTSQNALKQSLKLASDELTIVTVIPVMAEDYFLSGVENVSDVLKKQGNELLNEAVKTAGTEKFSIITKLKEGFAHEQIIAAAEEGGCELVVMGRRGITRLERALVGSETSRLVGHFKGRTLIVPRKTTLGLKNIVIATDASEYSEAAFKEAVGFAKAYNGSLKIIHVVEVGDEFEAIAPGTTDKLIEKATVCLEKLKSRTQEAGVDAEIFVQAGDAYSVIVDLAREVGADIIFMGSHGRTGLPRLFMGSVATRVIGHTECPVMVISG